MAVVDEDDWREWKRVGDPVLHIQLRSWADLLLIAPLSANTLAKVAQVSTFTHFSQHMVGNYQ